MLEIQNQEHFESVKKFAEETGRMEQLQKRLDYLDTYAEHGDRGATKCVLGYDWAPHSFSFCMMRRSEGGEYRPWFNGGLIFHGSHDGGGNGSAPTFSVNLNPVDGWSVHT
jgi:hypothetical protein